jgi:hypothetical protein
MDGKARKRLERFAAQLSSRLGDGLVALLLYGPPVRRDDPTRERDLTTLLVVRDASPSGLRPIEPEVAAWTRRGNPPPLIFSERGWRASTDVFPIEIEEMREAHELLAGGSPFDGLATSRDDLRRELEREVRSKLLRLRTEFAAAAPRGRSLEDLLVGSIGTFFILFRAVLRLAGSDVPAEREALVRRAAEVTGMDADAFGWVLAKLDRRASVRLRDYDPVGDRYLEQIARLADWVDQQQ